MAEYVKTMGALGLRALLTVAESYALQRNVRLQRNGNPWMLDPGVAQLLAAKGLARLIERTQYHWRAELTPKGAEVVAIIEAERQTTKNISGIDEKKKK